MTPLTSWRQLLCAFGVILILAGCGLPLDDAPRTAEAPATSAPNRSQTPEGGDGDTIIYFISANTNLTPVTRIVDDPTPINVLNVLLDGPSDTDRSEGRTSSVPSTTELLGLEVNGNQLVIDLTEDFSGGVGAAGQQAAAQIVYTMSELDDVESISFEVEGEPIAVSSPNRETGDTDVVDRCDYFTLLPDQDEADDEIVNQELRDHTNTLRTALSGTCPQIEPTPSVP